LTQQSLNIALKEWDTVCDALRNGRQIILLRKGGIADRGSEFRLEHDRFLIFPTFVHQNYQMLKPEAHARFRPASGEPDHIQLDTVANVTDIMQLKSRAQMDVLDAEHIWSAALIDMRFSYKPQKPLYLMIVRAYVLCKKVTIENTPEYAGCKSWVPLTASVRCDDARAVLSDATFDSRRNQIVDFLDRSVS
jgi:hypothetical protein